MITYYGLKRANIMVFKGLSFDVMVETFRHVVVRIERGEFGNMKRVGIVDKLKSAPHIFRGNNTYRTHTHRAHHSWNPNTNTKRLCVMCIVIGGTATDAALKSDAADQLWMNELLSRARKEYDEDMQFRSVKKSKKKVSCRV